MKKVRLLHNPTAGDNDFSKKELIKLISNEGFDCSYASVKDDGWDQFEDDIDFLAVAGGDGTVRRVAKALMKRKRIDKQFPVALLPHGTANNIACALGIDGEAKDIVKRWHHYHVKTFDIGKVRGTEQSLFFLEGFGYGLFPYLMKVMSKLEEESLGATAEEKLHTARQTLCKISEAYEAKHCQIFADGQEYSGEYLMVEVMNIKSIGPNLVMAGDADPGDGWFNLVMVPESSRTKFKSYLQNHADGGNAEFGFTTVTAKNIKLICDSRELHVDDERIKLERPVEINIEMMPAMMKFLITDD